MHFSVETKIKSTNNVPMINDDVKLGNNVKIEGNVIIEEGTIIEDNTIIKGNVFIGKNNRIGSNTVIKGNVEIGNNNFISDFVSIGIVSQHAVHRYEFNIDKFNIETKLIKIGNNNVIREFTTVHLPTIAITEIKNNCYIMAYCHISHDTRLFNGVILTNNAQIGGHTTILPYANLGLSVTVHPRITIGGYSIIGMGAVLTKNILPFVTAIGQPAKPIKINKVGLLRNGKKEQDIIDILSYYKKIENPPEANQIRGIKVDNDLVKEQIELFLNNQHENKKIAELDEFRELKSK